MYKCVHCEYPADECECPPSPFLTYPEHDMPGMKSTALLVVDIDLPYSSMLTQIESVYRNLRKLIAGEFMLPAAYFEDVELSTTHSLKEHMR